MVSKILMLSFFLLLVLLRFMMYRAHKAWLFLLLPRRINSLELRWVERTITINVICTQGAKNPPELVLHRSYSSDLRLSDHASKSEGLCMFVVRTWLWATIDQLPDQHKQLPLIKKDEYAQRLSWF